MDLQIICQNIIGIVEIQYNPNFKFVSGLSWAGQYQWAFCAI